MDANKLKAPNTFIIIGGILLLVAIATWILPAGSFDRQEFENRQVVVPGTYQTLEAQPQGLASVLMAPMRGFVAAADIIAFVLLVGGAFGVLQKTGAIDAGIAALVRKTRGSRKLSMAMIPIIMFVFSFFGALFGMSEEVIPFVLVFVPLSLSLGYDSIVGVAMPFVGAGFAGAFLNPFTVGVAQAIAQLPPGSGFGYRVVCWCVITTTAVAFVMWYAHRIHREPQRSPVYELDVIKRQSLHLDSKADLRMTSQHIQVLVVGVLGYGWYIEEIAGLFLGAGIAAGVAGRMRFAAIVDGLVDGARSLLSTALIIAVARAILVVAERGRIIDTCLNALASLINGLPGFVCAQIMFFVQSLLNFFVPSGSGQAALTMPVMAPLGDLVGVSRQTAVLAYQFGDGFSNLIIPTSAVCMGVLALGGVPWEKWARWILPLQIMFVLLGMLLLIPPFLMGW